MLEERVVKIVGQYQRIPVFVVALPLRNWMTPFGALFRHFRTLRGVSQEDVGRRIDRDHKWISSLETGRRQPPEGAELVQLFDALKLPATEREQLSEAARNSSFVIRIPRDSTPMDMALIHKLAAAMKSLEPEKKLAIRALLGGSST